MMGAWGESYVGRTITARDVEEARYVAMKAQSLVPAGAKILTPEMERYRRLRKAFEAGEEARLRAAREEAAREERRMQRAMAEPGNGPGGLILLPLVGGLIGFALGRLGGRR